MLARSIKRFANIPAIPNSGTNHLAAAKSANNFQLTTPLLSKPAIRSNDKLKVSHFVVSSLEKNKFCVNVMLNAESDQDEMSIKPALFVCALDTSGSMSDSVSDGTDKEVSKYNRLDLVQHSVNTMIHCLRPEDQLSFVTFNDNAKIVMPPTNMTSSGKQTAMNAYKSFRAAGMTNLWEGLDQSLNIMSNEQYNDRQRTRFTLLLTDGLPNVSPSNGILNEFMTKLPLSTSVNTFGYGYELDSNLLLRLAQEGGGSFAHIPDYTMCNTVFINFLANCMSTSINNISCDLDVNPKHKINPATKNINIGSIQKGQTRNIMFEVMTNAPEEFVMDMKFTYDNQEVTYSINNIRETELRPENYAEVFRYLLTNIIRQGLESQDTKKACKNIDFMCEMINGLKNKTNDQKIINQLNGFLDNLKHPDVNFGQVYKAFSNPEYFNKWGPHYLRYLSRSHELQICSNFKDTSLQHYGGKLFKELRTEIEDIFKTIPVPQPSLSHEPFRGNYTKSFYSQSGPCFEGSGLVHMADGSRKRVSEIKKGDHLQKPAGWTFRSYPTVECVIKTEVPYSQEFVNVNGLLVTPWHPVYVDGKWQFPIKLYNDQKVVDINCDYVYNFVLNAGHIIRINGVDAITLGHGVSNDKILEHPFLGTQKVIDDLKQYPEWNSGLIELYWWDIERDETGRICSFSRK